MNVDLDEAQGQMVVLALAHLAAARPGWKTYLEETAQSIGGGDLFGKFYQYQSNIQPEAPVPVIPTAKQLEGVAIKRSEEMALSKLVDEFAKEMKAKLFEKYRRYGRTGWDDPANRALIELKLFEHVNRSGQYVDVANLAAFLWNMRDQK